jgi:hypothetical protein
MCGTLPACRLRPRQFKKQNDQYGSGSSCRHLIQPREAGLPVANPLCGTVINGLSGRVLELQARFSFWRGLSIWLKYLFGSTPDVG